MKTVTRLAFARIKAKKSRTAVICGAIFLTVVLFMTVVSISVNLLTGYFSMLRLESGTDYHGYPRTARFTVTGDVLRDKIRASEDIAEASISSNLTVCALYASDVPSSSLVIRAVESEYGLAHFYTEITEGRFPAADDEILLNPQFFPDVGVGERIGLYYTKQPDDTVTAETAYAEFTVCGLMRGRSDAQLKAVMRYSDTLPDTYGFPRSHMNVYFMFRGRGDMTGRFDTLVNETLAAYLREGVEAHGVLNPAYLETALKEALNPATVFMILFSVSVVFLCSFLLIYNIYAIALTQDMQALGLLSVIGTTHRQLRQVICAESLLLFAVTLPVGLVGGYFIGWRMLSPVLFSSLQYEGVTFVFDAWIPVLTLLLTLFTLLWSATRPLAKLKTMTPIATVSYSPSTDLPMGYVRRKNYARRNRTPLIGRLATHSISRNRKKTVITALSMSLSVMLFVLIATLCDYMITYTENSLQYADYILKTDYTYRYEGSMEEKLATLDADRGVGIAAEFVKAVENSAYVASVETIRTVRIEIPTPAAALHALAALETSYKWFSHYPALVGAREGTLDVLVIGIPDALFPMLMQTETQPFGDTVGDAVIMETDSFVTDDPAHPYTLSWLGDGDTVRLGAGSYPVRHTAALVPEYRIADFIDTARHRAVLYVRESVFLAEYGEGLAYALLADAKEDCYDLLGGELQELAGGFAVAVDDAAQNAYLAEAAQSATVAEEVLSYALGISGSMDGLLEMREIVRAIETVGYSLASMIFLVGVLNIVNTSLSSVTERKREFAMLEAIGMTDGQFMRMLLGESLCGGILAAAITVCIGFPLTVTILSVATDGPVGVKLLAGVGMLLVCIPVSLISGLCVFRLTKSASTAERIKEE